MARFDLVHVVDRTLALPCENERDHACREESMGAFERVGKTAKRRHPSDVVEHIFSETIEQHRLKMWLPHFAHRREDIVAVAGSACSREERINVSPHPKAVLVAGPVEKY